MTTIQDKLVAIKALTGYVVNSLMIVEQKEDSAIYKYIIVTSTIGLTKWVIYGFTYDNDKDTEEQIVTSENGFILGANAVRITDGVEIAGVTPEGRLKTDADVSFSPEGIAGDEFPLYATRTYGQNETHDIISHTVEAGKKVFVTGMGGTVEKTGAVLSPFTLIRDVAEEEEELIGWYGQNPKGSTFTRTYEFNAGEKIIVRITNTLGNNVDFRTWLNCSEVSI